MKKDAFLARAAELQSNLRKAHDDIRLLFGATGRSIDSTDCNQALDELRSNLEPLMRDADRIHRTLIQPLREDDIAFEVPERELSGKFSELARKTIAGALNYYRNDMHDEDLFEPDFLDEMKVDGERMPDHGVWELIERFRNSE